MTGCIRVKLIFHTIEPVIELLIPKVYKAVYSFCYTSCKRSIIKSVFTNHYTYIRINNSCNSILYSNPSKAVIFIIFCRRKIKRYYICSGNSINNFNSCFSVRNTYMKSYFIDSFIIDCCRSSIYIKNYCRISPSPKAIKPCSSCSYFYLHSCFVRCDFKSISNCRKHTISYYAVEHFREICGIIFSVTI